MSDQLKILIIDDLQDDADLLAQHMRRMNLMHRYVRIDTSEDLNHALRESPWDIILCDQNMPAFDAFKALSIITSQTPNIPVIVVSGSIGEEKAVQLMIAGARDLILKDNLDRLVPSIMREVAATAERRASEKARREVEEKLQVLNGMLEKRVEARTVELHEREQKIKLLLDSTAEGIIGFDLQGECVFSNRAGARLLGHDDHESMVGRPIDEVITYVKSDGFSRKLADTQIPDAVHNGEAAHGSDESFIGAGNTELPVEYWLHPVIRDDAHVGAVLTFVDISQRRAAEATAKTTLAALKRSNEDLEQFAYVASHDLQEPLRSVASYAELLASRYEGQLDAKADEYIRYMVDGAERMRGLILDLLDYSRITTRGKPLTTIDSEAVFQASMNNLRAAIEESDTKLVNGGLPQVYGDAGQLGRVFQNLVSNSIKYRSELPPVIEVKSVTEDGFAHFTVSDNGIGIDPNFADRVFTLFQRLHTRDNYPGSGIGLSVCKRIIQRHGGRIWIDTEREQGTSVHFTIPTTQSQES